MSGSLDRIHVYPSYGGEDDHGFPDHRPGCPAMTPSGCNCWSDLVTAEHLTDGRPCWCRPQIVEVLGTGRRVVVHRRMEC
jgi:hypothetical protein